LTKKRGEKTDFPKVFFHRDLLEGKGEAGIAGRRGANAIFSKATKGKRDTPLTAAEEKGEGIVIQESGSTTRTREGKKKRRKALIFSQGRKEKRTGTSSNGREGWRVFSKGKGRRRKPRTAAKKRAG